MFAVDDLDDTLARLREHGAQLVDEVVQYEDVYRLCYVRGPEGILIGLAERIGRRPRRARASFRSTRAGHGGLPSTAPRPKQRSAHVGGRPRCVWTGHRPWHWSHTRSTTAPPPPPPTARLSASAAAARP
jgi:hypothetical protein